MKRTYFILLALLIPLNGNGQDQENVGLRIQFRGIVIDASTFEPVSNSQIMINKTFSAISDIDGSFSFYVNIYDTVLFKSLGYQPTELIVSDTLSGREFLTGIYMKSDTLSIGEVIIIPKYSNLKYEIMNATNKTPSTMENARQNVAVSAYQGRINQNRLGDPSSNYELLRQQQKVDAYERGGIPSDKMLGLSPFMLIPAAYLLIHGLPEKPNSFKPELTIQEMDEIQKKYLKTHK